MSKTIGTVCFIIQNDQVLLAEIEYPDGKRLWNGIGGVVEEGESPEEAVSREISEETKLCVRPEDAKVIKIVHIGDLELHVLIATTYTGILETVDPTLKKLRWFDINKVPYDKMHAGNDVWLPEVLRVRT